MPSLPPPPHDPDAKPPLDIPWAKIMAAVALGLAIGYLLHAMT